MKIHRKHGKVPIQDFKNLKIHYLCPFVENIGNMYLNAFKKTLRKTFPKNRKSQQKQPKWPYRTSNMPGLC
jgi:hypothetical protein